MKSCEGCRWCFLEDYGYSNYTTEGTQVFCLQSRHPSGLGGFDRFYAEDLGGEPNPIYFAEQCSSFEKGTPIECDVDKERQYDSDECGLYSEKYEFWWHAYTDDPEVRSLMAFHEAGYEVRRQKRLI